MCLPLLAVLIDSLHLVLFPENEHTFAWTNVFTEETKQDLGKTTTRIGTNFVFNNASGLVINNAIGQNTKFSTGHSLFKGDVSVILFH
jgi:hypothetical protein